MAESKSQMLSIAGVRNTLGAYNILDNNYFKLCDICCALTDMGYNIEVTWDGAKNAINLITGQSYTRVGGEYEQNDSGMQTANISSSAVYLNGTPVDITAYNINDNNFFKLRDLCRALNIYIEWTHSSRLSPLTLTGHILKTKVKGHPRGVLFALDNSFPLCYTIFAT